MLPSTRISFTASARSLAPMRLMSVSFIAYTPPSSKRCTLYTVP
jgi:hypothetical protein